MVVTEKLDGGNTLLHMYEVYGRSVPAPSIVKYARKHQIPLVPVLYEGVFRSVDEIQDFVRHAHTEPSALGGAREGVVIRLARAFPDSEFHLNVCKSVREDHVQSDEHWSKDWRACRIARA